MLIKNQDHGHDAKPSSKKMVAALVTIYIVTLGLVVALVLNTPAHSTVEAPTVAAPQPTNKIQTTELVEDRSKARHALRQ